MNKNYDLENSTSVAITTGTLRISSSGSISSCGTVFVPHTTSDTIIDGISDYNLSYNYNLSYTGTVFSFAEAEISSYEASIFEARKELDHIIEVRTKIHSILQSCESYVSKQAKNLPFSIVCNLELNSNLNVVSSNIKVIYYDVDESGFITNKQEQEMPDQDIMQMYCNALLEELNVISSLLIEASKHNNKLPIPDNKLNEPYILWTINKHTTSKVLSLFCSVADSEYLGYQGLVSKDSYWKTCVIHKNYSCPDISDITQDKAKLILEKFKEIKKVHDEPKDEL